MYRLFSAVLVFVVLLAAQSAIAVSLTGFYKLDETSGTSAVDATTLNGAGTYQNLAGGLGASASPGDPAGNSVEFLAGANNRRVTIPTAGGLTDGGNFTITAWARFNDNTQDHTIMGGPGTFPPGITCCGGATTFPLAGEVAPRTPYPDSFQGDPRGVGAAGALNDSDWHLVALSFDSGSGDAEKVYVDGARTMSGNASGEAGTLTLTNTLNIGNVGKRSQQSA